VDELAKSGFGKEKFYVVSQPISFSSSGDSKDVRRQNGIPADAPVVLHVGRLDQDKNLSLLTETICYVLRHSEKIHFLIVGGGGMANSLRGQLHFSNVHFVGSIPRRELPDYYKAADVFLMPSLSEMLSNVVAEALHHGLPVVSADSGCITRSLVSNISNSPEGLGEMLLSGDVQKDTLPSQMQGKENARLWKNLIAELMKQRNDA
jgi:glycosyltransferase involved in cell wall biosynthesis